MARYFFDLRDGQRGYVDRVGVELAHENEARSYARAVASDLLKNREGKARHWRIDVRDAHGEKIFDLAFIAQDRTLSHLSPPLKKAMEELSVRCFALREAIAKSRVVQCQSKAVMAKSRGKPYLAADEGEDVLGSL